MRPLGWTSGDAAGLPILPGLVRYDEVAAGEIDHVIRFTAPKTANAYVWPASHKAGSGGSSDPPMGAWFRLKASYDISHFSAQNQVILRALKKHGMVLADNGSPFYMSGAPDSAWNNSDLNALKAIPGSAFEAVDVSSLKLSNTSYAVASAAPPPTAPVNTAWPVLSGTARDGQTLSTTNGTWTGTAPITYSYAWRRCDTNGANCTTIANASGQSYVLTAADVGSKVYSLVTATNAGGSASQRSALSAVVSAAKPVNTAWPVLSGTARDGQTLSTTNGTWTGTAPITYSYAWRRCDTNGANCSDHRQRERAVLRPDRGRRRLQGVLARHRLERRRLGIAAERVERGGERGQAGQHGLAGALGDGPRRPDAFDDERHLDGDGTDHLQLCLAPLRYERRQLHDHRQRERAVLRPDRGRRRLQGVLARHRLERRRLGIAAERVERGRGRSVGHIPPRCGPARRAVAQRHRRALNRTLAESSDGS